MQAHVEKIVANTHVVAHICDELGIAPDAIVRVQQGFGIEVHAMVKIVTHG